MNHRLSSRNKSVKPSVLIVGALLCSAVWFVPNCLSETEKQPLPNHTSLEASETLSSAPPEERTGNNAPWWKHAVFYEIYPRSFCDTDNDGIGDLNGITSKLPYLKSLGIDAIWITPCYPSPQVDFGYDISDYCSIAPEYGTLAEFERLVAEAKAHGIKIIMDLVMNHTSNKHPWFIESSSSRTNPKHDWYMWRDGNKGKPPNNWQSLFGHSAWTWDPKRQQYYYHYFYAEQPDLNWRNPEVRDAMYKVARFWLDKGVAGFRLDAVLTLFEAPELTDNPILPGKNKFGDPNMEDKYNVGLPEVHDVLRELRQVLEKYSDDRVLIGETSGKTVEELSSMFGNKLDEIQLPMNFLFAYINKLSISDFRQRIQEWNDNPAHGWPLYFFSNHDQIRHYIRYGDNKNNDRIAKLTATLLLTLRGTPLLYYGEELGMENNDPRRVEDVYDPIGRTGWPAEKGRDGERTPMQWNSLEHAGFSLALSGRGSNLRTAKPWLLPPPSFRTHNVEAENRDPNSILNFYKRLIALRKHSPALLDGSYQPINTEDQHVLAYLRRSTAETVLVAVNMSGQPLSFSPTITESGLDWATVTPALSSDQDQVVQPQGLKLSPYGVWIGRLKQAERTPN